MTQSRSALTDSCGFKALEARHEPVAIGSIFVAVWQMDALAIQALQCFEHRAVLLDQQPLGHMESIIRVDSNQMCIEGGMMDLRQWNAIGDRRLPKPLVLIGNDVSGVQKQRRYAPRAGRRTKSCRLALGKRF